MKTPDLEKVISEDLVLDGDSHSGPEVILAVVSSDVNAALMMNLDWHRGQLIPEVLTDNNLLGTKISEKRMLRNVASITHYYNYELREEEL